MFAPKWARGPHNLARFSSWDPCITPGYWAWYLNVLPTSGSLFRSLFYAFMPREGIYTCVFCPPSSPQRRKPSYAALLRIHGNYFHPYLSLPRVCHKGAAYQWKFSYYQHLVNQPTDWLGYNQHSTEFVCVFLSKVKTPWGLGNNSCSNWLCPNSCWKTRCSGKW